MNIDPIKGIQSMNQIPGLNDIKKGLPLLEDLVSKTSNATNSSLTYMNHISNPNLSSIPNEEEQENMKEMLRNLAELKNKAPNFGKKQGERKQKVNWTSIEDHKLIAIYSLFPDDWKAIEVFFPQRDSISVKSRWKRKFEEDFQKILQDPNRDNILQRLQDQGKDVLADNPTLALLAHEKSKKKSTTKESKDSDTASASTSKKPNKRKLKEQIKQEEANMSIMKAQLQTLRLQQENLNLQIESSERTLAELNYELDQPKSDNSDHNRQISLIPQVVSDKPKPTIDITQMIQALPLIESLGKGNEERKVTFNKQVEVLKEKKPRKKRGPYKKKSTKKAPAVLFNSKPAQIQQVVPEGTSQDQPRHDSAPNQHINQVFQSIPVQQEATAVALET
ncbi:unnamed protein product [Moneuplotes crassus]|uniref:Myb-like domain-containing protein n=1 Tax=Euplotes crassus TaxID=5936 RepID=A0AAD1TZG7_EUPCR|nr:unnamed protein product [Moneuplotes crassus]